MLISDHWAVALEGVAKCYARGRFGSGTEVQALQRLTLKVAPGQVLGLLGPNGSGKSTTLKILAGLIRPSVGQAMILGHPAGSGEARSLIGYLPESLRLATHQTGAEFLRYCAGLSSIPTRHAEARVKAVLLWAALGPAAERRVETYSKGMLQRLGLAQAVLHEPQVVLLDEPASGLDPEGRQAMVRLIRDLAAQGRTVILTSHLLAQAEQICDRLALLSDGRLLASGSTAELLGTLDRTPPAATRLESFYLEKRHGQHA